jgi:hypothetical protein
VNVLAAFTWERKRNRREEEGGRNLQKVGEDDAVLESLGHPNQVERVFVDGDLLGKKSGVIGAEEAAAIWVDADAEIAHSYFEDGGADNVGYCCCYARVDLGGVVGGCVFFVVEGDEVDAGYEW